MKLTIIFILLNFLSSLTFPQQKPTSSITGKIYNSHEKTIRIGESDIPISENGKFQFKTQIESPRFFDVKLGDISWGVYLEPGKNLEMEVTSPGLSGMQYKGELETPNNILREASILNVSINDFFNTNWYKIHSGDETHFITAIDSLKRQYLELLSKSGKLYKNLPENFLKLFKADLSFGFNTLVYGYPVNHKKFTGREVILSKSAVDYAGEVFTDDESMLQLPSFVKYCKSRIDYETNILAEKSNEQRHYNLKKMDNLYRVLSSIFRNQSLIDYWYSSYLCEHIENTGILNSAKYVNEFNSFCKDADQKKKVNDLYNSYKDGEKDHIVKIFKTENGFKLSAHIFYPGNVKPAVKKPAVVIYYGGGLVLGNPSWAYAKAKHYSELGIIAVAAQYRLCNFQDITPIESIQDAKDIILWLRKKADSLKIVSNKVAASGWSMGAQLCISLAVFADTVKDSKINSCPDALLLTSPGTGSKGWFTELLNGAKVNPDDYSPIEHLRQGMPPSIILEGKEDTVTPFAGVKLFYDRLVSKGNYCELWTYDKVGHLFTPTYLGDNGWPKPDPEIQKQADKKSDEFLKKFGFIQ
jgi:acetyl esterase/lipase